MNAFYTSYTLDYKLISNALNLYCLLIYEASFEGDM